MEYIGDKKYWDEKFEKRSDKVLNPEKSLVESLHHLKKGSVLDIACGDGRNTLFLLENNFKVTGVDFSTEALERLEMFARRSNYPITIKNIDLNLPNSLENIGIFDNIIVNHYRLSKVQLADMKNHVTNNGILFICGFGHDHEVDAKIRKQELIQPTDFEQIRNSFELIDYTENQDERGFFVTYIFRKNDSMSNGTVNMR